MRSQSGCSACSFVSRQLRADVPCPFHAGVGHPLPAEERLAGADPEPDERSAARGTHPAANRPGLFTLREYARLLVLRSRIQERRQRALFRATELTASVEESRVQRTEEREAATCRRLPADAPPQRRRAPWTCPPWLYPYLGLMAGLREEPVEEFVNDRCADAESDPARAWRVDIVRVQVRLLEKLHAQGLLRHPI
jgi:hypothetical protein